MLKNFVFLNGSWSKRLYSAQAIAPKPLKGKWRSVVGLEVHAQISSESKLFSGAAAGFGAPLNSAVSYFDASIPGTLPVLNRKCVELGVKTALALGCQVNQISMFDRKHYFYADMPAGYQITQQRNALANNGRMTFPVIVPGKKIYYKTVQLLQLQLEQDSGKSLHDHEMRRSLVDLNRAGLPLMELVFAPDLETGEEAASLIKELILILRRLKTCSCKMEEGALRVDANISIHQEGEPYGVRTEVKNIGSVRSISQAVSYEIQRQYEVVSQGGTVINETRSWDAEKRCTVAMRDKEVVQDYRFMPEPNLPALHLNVSDDKCDETDPSSLVSVPAIAKQLPELPEATRKHLEEHYKLNQEVAIILVNEPILLDYFLQIISNLPAIPTKTVTNFLMNDLLTYCNKVNIDIEECHLTYNHLKDILKALHAEEINLQAARTLIELLHEYHTAEVNELIKTHNLEQISDIKTINEYCQQAIEKHSKAVKQYQSGKTKALFAIVGEVAKLSEQKANMKIVVKCLEDLLKEAKPKK
ncbi:glutamyl-tRNA(Gln) amidotransferase subunit B, mitochondrial-like [Musca domestica]|uniref:Glutamyl-tRNA(Gln) amidotransferase subunit B, mitochondrial n=1 Tax=Musca domestica TaxID=7370 RepID=A0ABM3V6D5_MUSDO|nr:glutamyl-tRNA(Gln) amidotransferase subunit B, mitochondrial-like [Musca domestica]